MMRIACLCPTYGRPHLVENTIAQFQRQTYPSHLRKLVILEDAGQIATQGGNGWQLHGRSERFPSLPAKYEELVRLAGDCDAYAIWDDDDIFLPWHLEAHAAAMTDAAWSHPRQIMTIANRVVRREACAGRFWSAMTCRRDAWNKVVAGGWYGQRRADFDQQFLRHLSGIGPPGRPDDGYRLSYVYGWGRSQHASSAMAGHGDENWYGKVGMTRAGRVELLRPTLDTDTKLAYELVGETQLSGG